MIKFTYDYIYLKKTKILTEHPQRTIKFSPLSILKDIFFDYDNFIVAHIFSFIPFKKDLESVSTRFNLIYVHLTRNHYELIWKKEKIKKSPFNFFKLLSMNKGIACTKIDKENYRIILYPNSLPPLAIKYLITKYSEFACSDIFYGEFDSLGLQIIPIFIDLVIKKDNFNFCLDFESTMILVMLSNHGIPIKKHILKILKNIKNGFSKLFK